MTKKALLIFAAVVVAVLFSFTTFTFAEEQGQATKSSEKTITYSDLQEQKKTIEELRTNYAKAKADYETECKEKVYKSMNDYPRKECNEKYSKLTTIYKDLNKEVDSYNKNVALFKTSGGQRSSETTSK